MKMNSSPPRDDGSSSISPIWGTVQGDLRALVGLAAGLVVGAGCLAAYLTVFRESNLPWAVAALCVVAAAAETRSARLGKHVDISIASLAIVFAAVALGPLPALIVGASTMAGTPIPYMRCAIYAAGRAVGGGLTGLTVASLPTAGDGQFVSLALASAVGVVVCELIDNSIAIATLSLRGVEVRSSIVAVAPATLTAIPLLASIVAPLAYVYLEVSEWALLLFLPPALVAHRLFVLYQEQRDLAATLASTNDRLERANLSFARSLVAALDARDQYTAGHSAAVAIYARDIARRMSLDPDVQKLAHFAGLLHDVGKVGLPPGILEKPGRLTPEERDEMEKHSEIGERILRNVDDYADVATVVRHHHERFDGGGYPDGIVGEAIPLLSRVLAVADAYNAMTSGRPYRTAMSPAEAILRLIEARSSQFDPVVLDAFLEVIEQSDDLYKRGATADFALETQAHAELRLPASLAA